MKATFTKATDTFKEMACYYLAIIASCGTLFSLFEHKKVLDGIWWAFVTAMTIGYGDIFPVTLGGKAVAVFLMHIVPLIVIPLIIVRMMSNLIEDNNAFTHEEQTEMRNDIKSIKKALNIQ